MNFVTRLLRKNTSPARIIGFVLSNFLGLAIVVGAMQFYEDASSLWTDDSSFLQTDYLVINKKVTGENTFGGASSFDDSERAELEQQPWVRATAPFTSADYRVWAAVSQGGRGMSTAMFFESIPGGFVDVPQSQWSWSEGSGEVPIIISRDYLTLYNFGFASAAGLPQMSEGIMSGIPLQLTLSSEDGTRRRTMYGRVAGYSNRLNTILVPQEFMDWSNREFGTGRRNSPSRMIIDVSRPGDVAITRYMDEHGYQIAGDKSGSSASFLLRLVTGIVMAIGAVITVLSFFILLLSISLLMERNRDKLHSLLMLGYDLRAVGRPYAVTAVWASFAAYALAVAAALCLRAVYLQPLRDLGAVTGGWWQSLALGLMLTLLVILFNLISIRRKVLAAWKR